MLTVVTGGTGHIGGNLVRALLAGGRQVRCLVHEADTRAIDGLDVERVPGDVREPDSLAKAFEGADVVYHLAARISIVGPEGGLVKQTNVVGVRNAVQACLDARVRRMVHFSSVHARKQQPLDQPLDETREFASGPGTPAYDESKGLGEQEILSGVQRGLDAVMVNPSGVIGPNDFRPSRMGNVFLDLTNRKLPALVAGGFDWVDARDVAWGAMAAEEKGRTGERYLLSGHWASVRGIAELWAEVSGVKPPRFDTPMWLARMVAPFALGISRISGGVPLFTPESLCALRANKAMLHDKAATELGYNPRPLKESLNDIHASFVETGRLKPRA